MSTFDYANQALRRDMAAYARALRTIVEALPEARALCDKVLKEVRLIQALLAFASGPQMAALAQIAYTLSNLWAYRDQSFARTLGFGDEINEARAYRDEARRGVALLARHAGNDPLAHELTVCLNNIIEYLEEEERLLIECDQAIRPHAENMEIARKRLNLLIAAIDARMPATPETAATLASYSEASRLLHDWESGVPLNDHGVEILETCIDLLERAGLVFSAPPLNPGRMA
jgi:signal transduction histidine kinase